MKRLFVILTLFLLFTFSVHALEMQSGEYKLEIEDIQAPTPIIQEEIKIENSTLTPDPLSLFEQQGYEIRTLDLYPFTITLKNTTIDFKNIHEEHNQTRDITLQTFHENYGYQLFIKQDTPFQTRQKEEIKATTCSNKFKPCTPQYAQEWTSTDTYGLGYNIQGKGSDNDFRNDTYYRPFSQKEYIPFASYPFSSVVNDLKINLKIQTQQTKQEQSYQGIISIIALPKL